MCKGVKNLIFIWQINSLITYITSCWIFVLKFWKQWWRKHNLSAVRFSFLILVWFVFHSAAYTCDKKTELTLTICDFIQINLHCSIRSDIWYLKEKTTVSIDTNRRLWKFITREWSPPCHYRHQSVEWRRLSPREFGCVIDSKLWVAADGVPRGMLPWKYFYFYFKFSQLVDI